MEQYIMKGGNPLKGEVTISGAKNAALGILAASIMTDETVTLENLPNVRDIRVLLQAIQEIGARVEYVDTNTVKINGSNISSVSIDYEFIRKIRASYYLLGALLGKYRKSQVALPGGCNIGSRPIDQHIKGFKALGAEVTIEQGMIATEADKLEGTHIYMDVVSVGATINVMMAAAMAEGKSIIENAAKEPHIVDVANFLNSMGANIKGAGTDVIRVQGVEKLHGTEYSIIPDQIEAGTFMCMAAATKGDVLIKNVIPKHLEAISAKLVEMGATVEEYDVSHDLTVMRILRAEEKRLRRSKQGVPISGTEGKTAEERASVLSLSYVSYEGCEDLEPYWLIDSSSMEESVMFWMSEKEFRATLTPKQLDIYLNCIIGGQSKIDYAAANNMQRQSVYNAVTLIMKKAKYFFKKF